MDRKVKLREIEGHVQATKPSHAMARSMHRPGLPVVQEPYNITCESLNDMSWWGGISSFHEILERVYGHKMTRDSNAGATSDHAFQDERWNMVSSAADPTTFIWATSLGFSFHS